jgi:hypothetical protein
MSLAPRALAVVTMHKMGNIAVHLDACASNIDRPCFAPGKTPIDAYHGLPKTMGWMRDASETEAFADREPTLPLHQKLENRDVERIRTVAAALPS